MDYRIISEKFLDDLYALGKQKRTKEIGNNMKGESFTLLYLALTGKPVTPGDIVNAMEISSARVAAMLNSLEKKDLISREIDPCDRRKILVQLTENGQKKADNCRECSINLVSMMMEQLGEEDTNHLIRIVGKISGFLGNLPVNSLEETECGKEEADVIQNQC